MKQQRWKGSPFLTRTCMSVVMAWVTYTGASPSTWADTREPIQSKNVTQAHPSMPFIPKYSIVPDTHAQNQMKVNKTNWTNPHTIKKIIPNSIDSTRVQLCSTKVCINTIRCFSAMICLSLNFASNSKEWWKMNRANRICFKGKCPIKVCLVLLFSPWGSGQPRDREL